MTNNYIVKTVAESLQLTHKEILAIYNLEDKEITAEDVTDVLRDETEEKFILLIDEGLTLFLNGLITYKRGEPTKKFSKKRDEDLTNNLVLKKLRIAFNLKDEDMLEIFALKNIKLSSSELTPYFRKEGHRNFKKCSDSLLKSFLLGYKSYINKK
ncbi:MAG: DUF1456 family protein [Campylobacterales bacterium]|nr:DUF1456 family protein [Campylobacterales bacterium]